MGFWKKFFSRHPAGSMVQMPTSYVAYPRSNSQGTQSFHSRIAAVWREFVNVKEYTHCWGSDHDLSGALDQSETLTIQLAESLLRTASAETTTSPQQTLEDRVIAQLRELLKTAPRSSDSKEVSYEHPGSAGASGEPYIDGDVTEYDFPNPLFLEELIRRNGHID